MCLAEVRGCGALGGSPRTWPAPAREGKYPDSTERGAFAARAAQVKRAYYKSCYSFNSADFQPMAFDNVGCPAPMMQRFINSLFTSAKEQKLVTNVAVAKRDFCVSLSAAFARNAAAPVRNNRQ